MSAAMQWVWLCNGCGRRVSAGSMSTPGLSCWCPGLLLGTEALVMTAKSADILFLFFDAGGAAGMLGLTPDQSPAKDGVPLDPPPSTRQGFGRMQLTSSLPLSSNPPSPFRMQVCASKTYIPAYWTTPQAFVHACIASSPAAYGHLVAVGRT